MNHNDSVIDLNDIVIIAALVYEPLLGKNAERWGSVVSIHFTIGAAGAHVQA